jgi:hypothetical protein
MTGLHHQSVMFDGDWVNISCLLCYFRRVELTNRVELSIPSPPHLNISLRVSVLIERQAVNTYRLRIKLFFPWFRFSLWT